ncbi:hypothetical protein KR093_004413 [Drosophila rubida]|uniref:Nucleosome assembly protein 1-like 1 n=1 Tax=Drosophila rubida TaxID=30044 RepID=A0AAD4PQQ2_9MUSC|nr:hypothetical protein KR093_004413 [Drosophila rubida]
MDAPHEGQFLIESPFFDRDGSPAMPAYLSAVGRRYYLEKMVSSMPEVVQKRIDVLKNLQLDQLHLEAEFYGELAKLQQKYMAKYQPLYEQRRDIIAGLVDTTQETRKWNSPPKTGGMADDEMGDFLRSSLERCTNLPKDVKGIPEFWLNVFKNTPMLCDMLHPEDLPVMGKLTDIAVKCSELDDSFVLEFHFSSNTYFSNAVLTKEYFQRVTVQPDDPFQFDGPEVYRCQGCTIDWLPNMDLTMRTETKRQRHKQTGMVRCFTQQTPLESFFNFFSPPELEANGTKSEDNSNEHIMRVLEADYDVGHFLRTRIIPRAVLYYTGEVVDDEDDELEDDDDDFSSSDESSEGEGGRKHSVNECPTH